MEAHDPVFEGCRNILYILLCVVLVVIKLVQLPVTINCNINMVLLQPVSVTSVYPLLPSQVVSTLLVPRAQTATGKRSSQVCTENAPVLDRPAPLRRLHDCGTGYKYPDLLTY